MDYPSVKARKMYAILMRQPLAYKVARQSGSHRTMRSANGYPDLRLAWHENVTIPPGLVRKTLVHDIGLTDEEALSIL